MSKNIDQFYAVTVQFEQHVIASYAKVDFCILYGEMDSWIHAANSIHTSSTYVVSHLLQFNDQELDEELFGMTI